MRIYKDFNECYKDISRLVFDHWGEYKFYKYGSTYHLDECLIYIMNNECDINISKLNYTFAKWKTLNNKYIDFNEYDKFKELCKTSNSRTLTFNFKIHEGKQSCLIAIVLQRKFRDKPWDRMKVFYRTTEVFKKFPVDLILFHKIWEDLPNTNLEYIELIIPSMFWRIEFLAELIGEGYFTIDEFSKNNEPSELIRHEYQRYYGENAELVKYKSIRRKQKMKQERIEREDLPIEKLKLGGER